MFTRPSNWQYVLKYLLLACRPINRVVYWIVDFGGNTGKSSFTKWFVKKKLATLATWDDGRDIYSLLP